MELLQNIFFLLRASSWTKAIFVLLGVIYMEASGYWPSAMVAAFAFCLIASAVYIYNDLQDLEEDRRHPHKCDRSLASGRVSVRFAVIMLVLLLLSGLAISMAVSIKLTAILGVYLLINLLYNHGLRTIPIFDVLCIASGFMLRILAGTIGIGLPPPRWLILTTTLLSLFIALNKRRLEMQLKSHTKRAVLKKYNQRLLDYLIAGSAIGCFISYLMFVVYTHHESFLFLMTLPFTGFGLWRYTQLTERERGCDDPVSLFFTDAISRINFLCFFVLTVLALQ